jgi:hypothetical protein
MMLIEKVRSMEESVAQKYSLEFFEAWHDMPGKTYDTARRTQMATH